MNIATGGNVPKDRRTNDEIPLNSPAEAAMTVGGRLRFGDCVLDLERSCLLVGDAEIALRPKAFDFLRYLAVNAGRLVPKDELMEAVWPDVIVSDDSIVQCVAELRRVLSDHDHRLIRTVQRRGYRFEASVSVDDEVIAAQETQSVAGGDCLDRVGKPAWMTRLFGGLQSWRIRLSMAAVVLLGAGLVAAQGWFQSEDRTERAPPLSIVVLPFKNLADDSKPDYFFEGVSNDLSTELSRIPGFLVIAHATARTFKGKNIDARQVGRELNVRYLLDGSMQRIDNTVRLNVQLIEAESGAAVWGERFVRRQDRLAAWRDEVVGRIATALNFRLTHLESERSLSERRENPEVFDLTAQGWALVYAAKHPDNYFPARALFRKAVERDPRAANALAGIGWTSAIMVLDGWSASPEKDIASGEAAALKALAINPNHFVAHHVRGFLFRLKRRPHAAHDAFRTALAINPNFAPGHAQLGAAELELGRPGKTIPAVEQAMRLSPRDPSLGPWLAILGMAKLHLGRAEEAATWLERAIDTGTPVAGHRAYLASSLALAGRMAEARRALAGFRKAAPTATIARVRAASKSTHPDFVAQREKFFDGLRLAGLPE